ncbi:MAG: ATP-binding protein [Treponema sp.]|nr:ATP-binding protein [Treponema sp.]
MKLSDIQETAAIQKAILTARESGHKRIALKELPDIRTHALVVSGIRRCGKSTLLHQFVKKLKRDFFYLNFDDLRLADFSHTDFALLDKIITGSGALLLFFDEIQAVSHWELYIRQKLDDGYQVILTGSNASLLSRELGTRLTGRHISKELFPFSYREFCSFKGIKAGKESLDDYLDKGGFPEYLKTDNTEILTQLQSDILYRDIAVRYGIRDISSLRRLYKYLVSNASQKISPSKLIHTAGVKSPTTVLEYFSYFEAAYLIHLLPCFAWSVKTQNLTPKKVYIADPGIIKTSSVSFSGNHGALLENFVYTNLRLVTDDIYYFTGKDGGECDFILHPHERAQCIQVCRELSAENQDREINGLLEAMDFFGQKRGVILTYNTEDTIRTGGKEISVRPAWSWA